jgi:hypothetical protein
MITGLSAVIIAKKRITHGQCVAKYLYRVNSCSFCE